MFGRPHVNRLLGDDGEAIDVGSARHQEAKGRIIRSLIGIRIRHPDLAVSVSDLEGAVKGAIGQGGSPIIGSEKGSHRQIKSALCSASRHRGRGDPIGDRSGLLPSVEERRDHEEADREGDEHQHQSRSASAWS